MKDEKSPLSSAVLLAEISDKIDAVASAATQQALYTAKAVRILDARHQLSQREHTTLEGVTESLRRTTARLERASEALSPRPASITVVADKPDCEGITTTIMLGQPWVGVDVLGKRIPSKWVARIFLVGFFVFGLITLLIGMGLAKQGVKPMDVVKAAAHWVSP